MLPLICKLEQLKRTGRIVYEGSLHFIYDKEFVDEVIREFIGAHETGVHDGTMDQLEKGKSLFKSMEDPFTMR